MAVFYVLPPRRVVAERWRHFWKSILPGAEIPPVPESYFDQLTDSLSCRPNTYLVFREDLPDATDVVGSLQDAFGAEVGDQLVEVRWSDPMGTPQVQVARISQDTCSAKGAMSYNLI